MTRRQRMSADDGASLVLALLFVLLVGGFTTVALEKSASTSLAGQQLRVGTQLQYALDGGVDRTLQRLRQEVSSGSATTCTTPTSPTGTGSFALNGQSVSWACRTLAGRPRTAADAAPTNFALIVTSPSGGGLETDAGALTPLEVAGSVFLNSAVTDADVRKLTTVTTGDLVSPSAPFCRTGLTNLLRLDVGAGAGQVLGCTEQTLAQALPTVALLPAPVTDLSLPSPATATALSQGVPVTSGGRTCTVYYPGLYRSPPVLANDSKNYFVSGLYYFRNTGTWTIDDEDVEIVAGQRSATTDSAAPANDCSAMGMDDSTAMSQPAVASRVSSISPYRFSHGVTWVFGGNAGLDLKKGSVTMFSPPAGGSTTPVNLVGASSYTDGSYAAQPVGTPLLTGGGANARLVLNAKVFAPNSYVEVFSTSGTVAAARGGVVAHRVQLKASASGSSALVVSADALTGNPAPPFRTVEITTTDASSASTASNRAVATISNFSPFSVRVLSWRTG